MLTFEKLSDLEQLPPNEPARSVIHNLLKSLITQGQSTEYSYDPNHDGYIVLVDRGDVDTELNLFDPPRKLEDVFWEGTHIDRSLDRSLDRNLDRDFFAAIFIPNNQFTLICVIENADWLPRDLRRTLCACLVSESL